MEQNNIEGHLWNIGCKHAEWKPGLETINISYRILENSISRFAESQLNNDPNGPIIAYGYAKLLIIEAWNIRSNIIYTLKGKTPHLDTYWPSLKIFRDAISHLDERVQGNILVKRKKVALKSAKGSLAGGLAVSENGLQWQLNSSLVFNFNFDGVGAITPFGMLDDFVLTNTDTGIEEIRMSKSILDAIDEDILAIQ